MSDYQVIIHKDLLPDGVSVEDVFMAVEVRPVQSVEIKPYLDRLVEACRVLSGHIEWDIERGVIQLHDIVQGHVTAYRQESAPEMYAALQAVKYWSFAEAELEELRGKAMEIDAALTEAQKQLEVLYDEYVAVGEMEGVFRLALQHIYDLANKNAPADLQTRMDTARRLAANALESKPIRPEPPLFRQVRGAIRERNWRKRQEAEPATETVIDHRRVPKPVERTPASQEALENALDALKNAWKERDYWKSVVDAAHNELDTQGVQRSDWDSPHKRHELTLAERIQVLSGQVRDWFGEVQVLREQLHALLGDDDRS